MGFIFDFSGKSICFLGKLLPATSISTNAGRFLSIKLAAVLIVMNFGARFQVKLSMASLHLGATIFIIQLCRCLPPSLLRDTLSSKVCR